MSRRAVVAALAVSLAARAQRPDEDALFGGKPDAGAGVRAQPSAQSQSGGKADAGAGVRAQPSAQSRSGGKADAGTGVRDRPSTESRSGGKAATGAGVGARPSEESLFGGAPDAGTTPGAQESTGLDAAPSSDAFASGRVKEDPLKIGGLFYTRAFLQVSQDQPFGESRMSAPTLVDAYLDVRPTDRLRAFVLGRLTYDPFLSATVGGTALPGIPASTTASNPAVLLDQAWLGFDIAHSVFVTVGRQHVKWGVARFFSPTDFLASQPRDPLALFDARLGVTMIRAQVPWEKMGWNFSAVAVFEPTQNVGGGYSGSGSVENPGGAGINPTGTSGTALQDVGGAFRAEFAFKSGAFGLDGLAQRNRASRLGADLTMALGDLDFYGEVAWKDGLDSPTTRTFALNTPVDVSGLVPGVPPGTTVTTTNQVTVTIAPRSTPVIQAAGGVTYSLNFEGNKSITFGAEYFYNSASYSRDEYLTLLLVGGFQPFYVGKHYLALSATLLDTTAKTTWILSGIGNLSDRTYLARLDFVVTVLSYLSVESYVAGHFGRTGGELRLGFPRQSLASVPGVSGIPPNVDAVFGPLNAPIIDLGVGLRLSL